MLPENELSSGRDPRSSGGGMNSLFRGLAKKILGSLIRFLPRVQRSVDSGLTVFAFHDVSDRPSEFARQFGLVVSTATFERQIRWIKANFAVIHPSAILANEPLPKRAAVITFDDGYLGTFENGLTILERLGVPSIIFLNMQPILLGTPVLSAMTCFLDKTDTGFATFCHGAGLKPPFHLSLTPEVWEKYQRRYGPINLSEVVEFQGAFVDIETVRRWSSNLLFCYGNHLYEHWNAVALTAEELKNQYLTNDKVLSDFSAKVNLFAFTNGQPRTCFSAREVRLLKSLGAGKVFSTTGGVNQDVSRFLLGRVALCEADNDDGRLWFRIGRAILQDDVGASHE